MKKYIIPQTASITLAPASHLLEGSMTTNGYNPNNAGALTREKEGSHGGLGTGLWEDLK